MASLIASLLVALGLYLLVGLLSAGFLAVVFYQLRQRGAAIKAAAAALLGTLSGLFCFGILALLLGLASTVPDARTKMREQVLENAQRWAATRPGDPQVQDALNQLKTPEGFVMMMIIGGVFLLVLSVALGALGGALGGAILGRRGKP